MKQISRFFRKIRHADTLILGASAILLLMFAVTDLQPHPHYENPIYAPTIRCLILILICVVSYLGGLLRMQRTGSRSILAVLLWGYFLLYLYLILSLTLFGGLRLDPGRLAEAGLTKRQYYLRWFVNFRPFHSIYTVYIKGLIRGYVSVRYTLLNLLGNLCAFMPFAFFLPCFFKAQRKWYVFLPTMLLTVAAVEGMQFWLMVGSCDVDDLILNAGGAFLMFWILKIPPLRRFSERIRTGHFSKNLPQEAPAKPSLRAPALIHTKRSRRFRN